MTSLEIIETQNQIIKVQADTVTKLFGLVQQCLTLDELQKLDFMDDYRKARQLNSKLDT